jgi:hypothetical protein
MSMPERKLAKTPKKKKPVKAAKKASYKRVYLRREAEPWMENAGVIKDSAVAMEGSSKWPLMIILMSWYFN